MEQIRQAVIDLYGDWEFLPESSQSFIGNVMADGRFTKLYEQTVIGEKETKELLLQFEQDYFDITKKSNVDEITDTLQKKSDRASILVKLREKKAAIERANPTDDSKKNGTTTSIDQNKNL